jgi:hypothetical protein
MLAHKASSAADPIRPKTGRQPVKKVFLGFLLAFSVIPVLAGAEQNGPIIDNERVIVWDTAKPLSSSPYDFVTVSLAHGGAARLGHKGDIPGSADERSIIIELKDRAVPPLANNSGYPNAFPRPRIEKLLENDRVVVWRYRWNPGEPTPMHYHDKDLVVTYLEDMALTSTTLDGNSVSNHHDFADTRYSQRDRVHTETLISQSGSAIITELK